MPLASCDPGINNGLVVLTDDGDDLLLVTELPFVGDGADRRLALAGLGDLIRQFHVTRAVIENVGAMPKQGLSSTYKFGRATGQIEGALMALGVPLGFVRPNIWKKPLGVTGKTGAGLRALCVQRWPKHQSSFVLAKHEHRASAALIGAFWLVKSAN